MDLLKFISIGYRARCGRGVRLNPHPTPLNLPCTVFLRNCKTYVPFFITDNGCGGTLTDSQGWLLADKKIQDCLWTLVAPHDKIIEIEIRSLRNLKETYTCSLDFVEVNI